MTRRHWELLFATAFIMAFNKGCGGDETQNWVLKCTMYCEDRNDSMNSEQSKPTECVCNGGHRATIR